MNFVIIMISFLTIILFITMLTYISFLILHESELLNRPWNNNISFLTNIKNLNKIGINKIQIVKSRVSFINITTKHISHTDCILYSKNKQYLLYTNTVNKKQYLILDEIKLNDLYNFTFKCKYFNQIGDYYLEKEIYNINNISVKEIIDKYIIFCKLYHIIYFNCHHRVNYLIKCFS